MIDTSDLSEDIIKIERYLHIAKDFETRLALTRLLEVIRSWKVNAHIRKTKTND